MKILINLIFVLFFHLLCFLSHAQKLKLYSSKNISGASLASKNKNNQLFIVNKENVIEVYDSLLIKLENQYSPRNHYPISSIDTFLGRKIFLFSNEFQNFIILDRFLNKKVTYTFNNVDISSIRLATISHDNNIWVTDEGDMTLKKVNPTLNQIISTYSLDLLFDNDTFEAIFMKEYQNQLFICVKNYGIIIFDNLGNFKKKIKIQNINFFSFFKNQLVYTKNKIVYFYDIYKDIISRQFSIDEKVKFVFAYQNKVITVSENKLNQYNISPLKKHSLD